MADKKERKKRRTVVLTEEQQQKAEQKVAERKKSNPDDYDLPVSKRTVQDLEQFFIRAEEGTKHILPIEKRRYVIYLRKSTDDESKQVRSLEDQRSECLELASRLGIVVRDEDIFEESASAKKSGNRPIFDAVVMGFKTGKYHGLLAWSPDRLSRNMKEAGEIIEMIDLEEIQDLHFKTYQFENSPNGKMLLGILFATSKQYSDKLSVDVKRGTDGNIKEGKYNGVVKKGYFVDASTGYFLPDGYNWDLLREAVNMRLYEGKTNIEVAEFLNDSHLSVRKDQDSEYKVVKMNKARVGELFEDPFYFGLYQYGDKVTNLTEMTGFLPLITPDEYIQLNQKVAATFGTAYAGKSVQNKRLEYGLLRGKVICDYCDVPMQFQHQQIKRGKHQGRWLISFYCRNKSCLRHDKEKQQKQGIKLSKSIRAKYVMAHIEWTMRHLTKKSKKAYQLHIDKLRLRLAQDTAIAKRKLAEAKNDLRINEKQYLRYQDFQVTHPVEYKKHHAGKLEHYQSLIRVAEHNIKTAETELKRLSVGLPSEQEFYELVQSYLLRLLQTTDLMEQDAICNELVSNLRAGDDSVSVFTLNKPYDLLLDLAKVPTGRGDRT